MPLKPEKIAEIERLITLINNSPRQIGGILLTVHGEEIKYIDIHAPGDILWHDDKPLQPPKVV